MEVRPPAPLPLLRTQPFDWGGVAPPSGMPARDVWVDCRQSTPAAAQPLQASRWHSDVTVDVSPDGVATGWQRGARTYKALLPPCRSAVPSMRKGEGRPRCRPPFPPGAHPKTSWGAGREKAGRREPGRSRRRFGLFPNPNICKLRSSGEHVVILLNRADVQGAFITSCSGRIEFNVMLGTE